MQILRCLYNDSYSTDNKTLYKKDVIENVTISKPFFTFPRDAKFVFNLTKTFQLFDKFT